MPSPPPNPYQPPKVDAACAIEGAVGDALKTRSRAEFDAEVTGQDIRDAFRRSPFRRDWTFFRRFRRLLLIPIILIVLVQLSRWSKFGTISGTSLLALIALGALAAYLAWIPWWMLRKYVKLHQGSAGPVSGWMDRESLWLETQNQVRYRPLSQLVGAAVNNGQLVLSFDPSNTLFELMPLRGFDDPDTAEILAGNLAGVRPPSAATAYDSRRLTPPTDSPRFTPGEDALAFSGDVLVEDIKGTTLARHRSFARWMSLGKLSIALVLAYTLILLTGDWDSLTVIVLIFIAIIYLRAIHRLIQSGFAGQASGDVMFCSSGWIDRSGLVSMTSTGQWMSKWSDLDNAMITDQVISVRVSGGAYWLLVGRRQFDQDSQWQAACELVRQRVPA